jgi:hypothetical protein
VFAGSESDHQIIKDLNLRAGRRNFLRPLTPVSTENKSSAKASEPIYRPIYRPFFDVDYRKPKVLEVSFLVA